MKLADEKFIMWDFAEGEQGYRMILYISKHRLIRHRRLLLHRPNLFFGFITLVPPAL